MVLSQTKPDIVTFASFTAAEATLEIAFMHIWGPIVSKFKFITFVKMKIHYRCFGAEKEYVYRFSRASCVDICEFR